ncbi:hypothetical protein [Listeria valentina]|uniref:hypothetical protein n=1 Tax=Listeria valentina TaxID=2705293 RepID=UPI001431B081|nr:hypothetical protein [Listeria valentina]
MRKKSFQFEENQLTLPIEVNGKTHEADISALAVIRYQNLSRDLSSLIVLQKETAENSENGAEKAEEIQKKIEQTEERMLEIFFNEESQKELHPSKLPLEVYNGIINYIYETIFPETTEEAGK